MESRIKTTETRKFLGKTENFKDKEERHFFQRMLRAYLKGSINFFFGFDHKGKPVQHKVLSSLE